MTQKNKGNYLNLSIIISIISILATTFINYQIAEEYLRVDGKTQALFGIKEMLQFGYQYYVIILGLSSLILAILSKREPHQKARQLIVFFLCLFAISIIFLRIWRFMV
jgi:uncharacterized membrane protein YidH (DUF202 family)